MSNQPPQNLDHPAPSQEPFSFEVTNPDGSALRFTGCGREQLRVFTQLTTGLGCRSQAGQESGYFSSGGSSGFFPPPSSQPMALPPAGYHQQRTPPPTPPPLPPPIPYSAPPSAYTVPYSEVGPPTPIPTPATISTPAPEPASQGRSLFSQGLRGIFNHQNLQLVVTFLEVAIATIAIALLIGMFYETVIKGIIGVTEPQTVPPIEAPASPAP